MYFIQYLPQAVAEFMQAGTGSSAYEHALVWSLVAVICILVIIAWL